MILALLASIPILMIFILMVIMRWPATKAMPIAWITAILLAFFVWETPPNWLTAASINGVFLALSSRGLLLRIRSRIVKIVLL